MTRKKTTPADEEKKVNPLERMFSVAFHFTPNVMAITDVNTGVIIDVNHGFEEWTGYSRDEVIGRSTVDLRLWVNPDDRLQIISDLEAGKEVRNYNTLMRAKNGDICQILFSARFMEIGSMLHLLTTAFDVTEQKRMERELRWSEERYRSLIETTRDLIYSTDRKGIITYANPMLSQALGYAYHELEGRSFAEIIAPEYVKFARDFFRRGMKEELTPIYDTEMIRKDGRRISVEFSTVTIWDTEGRPTGRQGIGRDITERKIAEKALRESEERYRSIFENTLLGIFQSTTSGTFIRVNPAFARMFGYSSSEEMVESVRDIEMQLYIRSQDRQKFKETMERYGIIENFKAEVRHRDGHNFWLSFTTRAVRDQEGNILYYDGTALDITDSKRAEDELRNSHEHMRALAGRLRDIREEERKRIARAIHDEMGQALTGIKMDLTWVQRKLSERSEIDRQKIAVRLESTGDLVDVTIREMRRIVTELRPGVLDDLGLIAAIEWLVQDFRNRTGIECTFDLPENEIDVDPEKGIAIFRITQEAMTNIIRHAEATKVSLSLAIDNGTLVLKVIDDGRGFAEVDARRTGAFGLLGMQERALAIGGAVEIRSIPDIGTTVDVRIPLNPSCDQEDAS